MPARLRSPEEERSTDPVPKSERGRCRSTTQRINDVVASTRRSTGRRCGRAYGHHVWVADGRKCVWLHLVLSYGPGLCNQEVKQLALHAAEARGLDKLQTTVQSALVSENETEHEKWYRTIQCNMRLQHIIQ